MKKKLLFILLLNLNFQSFARDFIIASIPEEPNRWVENFELKGIDIEIIDYIMKKMNISYKIILENSSARLEKNWQDVDSSYDMVLTLSKKLGREEYLYYPKESHITFSWNFFYNKGKEGEYKFETYEDLKGLKIGATKGFSYTKEFWELGNSGFFYLDLVVKNELQLKKLFTNRFDLVPLNTKATLYDAKKNNFSHKISYLPKPLIEKKYYNTFLKSSTYPDIEKIREKYDEILVQMKEDGTLKKIFSKYDSNL